MLGWVDQGEVPGNIPGSGFEGQGGSGRRKQEREAALKRQEVRSASEEQLGASLTEIKVCSGEKWQSRPQGMLG